MKKVSDKVNIIRLKRGVKQTLSDRVVREFPLTIFVNGKELVTLICTPRDLKALAVGFLCSEGFINKIDDITGCGFKKNGVVNIRTRTPVEFNRDVFLRRVLGSGCGPTAIFYSESDPKAYTKVNSRFRVSSSKLLDMFRQLHHKSALYRKTGGVHVAALADGRRILILKEDIGRHNAVDKVLGQTICQRRDLSRRILLTSGRLTSEIIRKAVRRGLPILASISAPTDLSVRLADELGLTLIGFVRGVRLNIYTHPRRVI